jgi:hypothetical protein
MQAEVPVHAGAGWSRKGLGAKVARKPKRARRLPREPLEAEHGVGLRERLARHEVDLVLRIRRLVRVAADGDALRLQASKSASK